MQKKIKIIFLHHSTGKNIWLGATNKYINKLTGKSSVQDYFNDYNKTHGSEYLINEQYFPKSSPYGWKNYPFDYYNIWVRNAGDKAYMDEPTLEILTKEYDVIIFKHCYPVSRILPDTGHPDINSEEKRLENYKLQYNAIKKKLLEFPQVKFILWTPAVHIKSQLSEDEALRTYDFYKWINNQWYKGGENIFLWDFYNYETEGDLYFKEDYSEGHDNSHPNIKFSSRISPLFCKFIIDVIESR